MAYTPVDLSQRLALDASALDNLKRQARTNPEAATREAGKQFEAMLLNMVLKNMRQSVLSDPLFGSSESKLYVDMLDSQLSQVLVKNGGLGLADLLAKHTANAANPASAQTGASAANEETLSLPTPTRIASPAPSETSAGTASPKEFVDRVWPHAVAVARETGISPHFMVAHAALETGWGKKEIRDANGRTSHNLFGVKAGESWKGDSVDITTTEYVDGKAQKQVASFRAYDSYADSFRDYARLLKGRYREAVAAGNDPEGFARGLQNGGYATDPMYADKLARVIRSNTLRQALTG